MQTDDESWKELPVRPNSDPHYPLPLAPYIRIYRNPDSAIRENFACTFWNPVYSTTNPESY